MYWGKYINILLMHFLYSLLNHMLNNKKACNKNLFWRGPSRRYSIEDMVSIHWADSGTRNMLHNLWGICNQHKGSKCFCGWWRLHNGKYRNSERWWNRYTVTCFIFSLTAALCPYPPIYIIIHTIYWQISVDCVTKSRRDK